MDKERKQVTSEEEQIKMHVALNTVLLILFLLLFAAHLYVFHM